LQLSITKIDEHYFYELDTSLNVYFIIDYFTDRKQEIGLPTLSELVEKLGIEKNVSILQLPTKLMLA